MHEPKGECIIHPRLSTRVHYVSPVMHKNWYLNYLVLLNDPKQLLVFNLDTLKCALRFSHVIDSEASDSLRVT